MNSAAIRGALLVAVAACAGFPAATAGEAVAAPAPAPAPELQARIDRCRIESAIVRYYVDWDPRSQEPCGAGAVAGAARALGDDPAAAYFAGFAGPGRVRAVAERCRAVEKALGTSQVSLSLAALMWRDLAEACFDGKPAADRTPEESALLRDALSRLEAKASLWQKQTLAEKLGAFLVQEIHAQEFKARPGPSADLSIMRALGVKRWGRDLKAVTEEYVAAHPFGESMQIGAACARDSGLVLIRSGKEAPAGAEFKLGIFDLLRTPGKAGEDGNGGAAPVLALTDRDLKLEVRPPAGCLLAYADVLRLAYEQNRAELEKKVAEHWNWPLSLAAWHAAVGEGAKPAGAELEARIVALVADLGSPEWERRDAASAGLGKLGASALPALRKAAESPDPEVKSRAAALIEELERPADNEQRYARIRLVSLWLF